MGSSTTNAVPTRSQPDGPGRGAAITLGECMASSTRRYLADLNGTPCREGLYARMLREIELPLLREVLEWSGGNQSRAADVLGIHRATLRKKLRELGIV
jgi:Fis family transcriptional regulator